MYTQTALTFNSSTFFSQSVLACFVCFSEERAVVQTALTNNRYPLQIIDLLFSFCDLCSDVCQQLIIYGVN
jgi:hypothetical protein